MTQNEELVLVADVTVYDRASCVFKYLTRFLFVQRHTQFRAIYDAVSLQRPEYLGISLSIQDPSVSDKNDKKLRKSAMNTGVSAMLSGGESSRKMLKSSLIAMPTGSLITAISISVPFDLIHAVSLG